MAQEREYPEIDDEEACCECGGDGWVTAALGRHLPQAPVGLKLLDVGLHCREVRRRQAGVQDCTVTAAGRQGRAEILDFPAPLK